MSDVAAGMRCLAQWSWIYYSIPAGEPDDSDVTKPACRCFSRHAI